MVGSKDEVLPDGMIVNIIRKYEALEDLIL